jgi:uncharacterized protein
MRQRNLLLLTWALMLSGVCAKSQQRPVESTNRTIAVWAEGHASAIADEGTLHVGFAVFGPDSASAYARGSKTSMEIVAALTQAGVPKEAIESDTQSISRTSENQLERLAPAERAERTYRLQQSWLVKVPAGDAGRMLGIAVQAGGNESGAIDWNMKDPAALHGKALEDAMSRAKATAIDIAQGMGVTLGPLISAANRAPALLPGEMMTWEDGGIGSGGGYGGGMYHVAGGEWKDLLALRPRKIEDIATVSAIYTAQ